MSTTVARFLLNVPVVSLYIASLTNEDLEDFKGVAEGKGCEDEGRRRWRLLIGQHEHRQNVEDDPYATYRHTEKDVQCWNNAPLIFVSSFVSFCSLGRLFCVMEGGIKKTKHLMV